MTKWCGISPKLRTHMLKVVCFTWQFQRFTDLLRGAFSSGVVLRPFYGMDSNGI